MIDQWFAVIAVPVRAGWVVLGDILYMPQISPSSRNGTPEVEDVVASLLKPALDNAEHTLISK